MIDASFSARDGHALAVPVSGTVARSTLTDRRHGSPSWPRSMAWGQCFGRVYFLMPERDIKATGVKRPVAGQKQRVLTCYLRQGRDYNNDNNDNDKRLGLTAKADQPDHKKIQ